MTNRPLSGTVRLAFALALAGAGTMVLAQNNSGDGVTTAAIDSGGSFEVGGVDVDVSAKTAQAARLGGWRIAQRKAWTMLAQRLAGHPATMSDSGLDAIVTGIVVENEQIGPTRYIARLGVLFDRGKAASILGVAAQFRRSAPMLIVPLEWSGGAGRVFERETAWQRAWSRFRAGNSSIDYVRPTGTGPDSLLLNLGQTQRNGRGWWRTILDQYGAADVLIPEVRLRREWPGGPIVGTFIAGHGPDNVRLGEFRLRVSGADALDALLDAGIQRLDQIYQNALASGALRTDSLLGYRPPAQQEDATDEEADNATAVGDDATPEVATQAVTVQVETPTAGSVSTAEASLRGVPGVRSATTTSLALGGVSVMRVSFDGDAGTLRSALEARGWQVQEGSGILRIRRPGLPPPSEPAGNATGG